MHAHNYVVSDEILTNGTAVDMAKNTDQISLYWFPEFTEVVVANWTIVDKSTPGTDHTNDHVPSTYRNFALVSSLAKEISFTLAESKCAAANTLGRNHSQHEYGLLNVNSFQATLFYMHSNTLWN